MPHRQQRECRCLGNDSERAAFETCDVKRKGTDLLVAPLKLNVRLSKCGPRSVGRSAVR